jgi:hypothetical protein
MFMIITLQIFSTDYSHLKRFSSTKRFCCRSWVYLEREDYELTVSTGLATPVVLTMKSTLTFTVHRNGTALRRADVDWKRCVFLHLYHPKACKGNT